MFYHIYIYIYISSRDSLPFFLYHDWAWKDTEAKIVRQVFLDQTFPSVTPFLSIYSYCTYPRPKNWNSRFHFIPSLVNVTRGIISNLVNFCTYFPRISRIRILTTHRKFHKDGEKKKKRKGKKLKEIPSIRGIVERLCPPVVWSISHPRGGWSTFVLLNNSDRARVDEKCHGKGRLACDASSSRRRLPRPAWPPSDSVLASTTAYPED